MMCSITCQNDIQGACIIFASCAIRTMQMQVGYIWSYCIRTACALVICWWLHIIWTTIDRGSIMQERISSDIKKEVIGDISYSVSAWVKPDTWLHQIYQVFCHSPVTIRSSIHFLMKFLKKLIFHTMPSWIIQRCEWFTLVVTRT